MKIDKNQLIRIVKILAEKLDKEKYAIRGTASLVLQGFDMNVDDIDILCDKQTALNADAKLADFLVDEVAFNESPKFKSYFGKFLIDGVDVEIMGDWQIFNDKKGWSKIYNANSEDVAWVKVDDMEIPVTKVALELEVFALMGRWTAYQKIKRLARDAGQSNQTSVTKPNIIPQTLSDQQKLF